MKQSAEALSQSNIAGLSLLSRGKVRDIYAVDDEHLLIVASDRISAFDVVLPDPVPGKGQVLTAVSNFWFDNTAALVANHLSGQPLESIDLRADELEQLAGRAVVVKRLKPLPIEAIVRGYLIGSGWKDYQRGGAVCGIELPEGLQQAQRLPEPIYTPSTKAAQGEHDENISFEKTVELLGASLAETVRQLSLELYQQAADYALGRGIIIADTKLEFGTDAQGALHLIDEVLTPDSSRFWPADSYRVGTSPPSFDKQYLRDYLETLNWSKKPPAPRLPAAVIANTAAKYQEAQRRLLD